MSSDGALGQALADLLWTTLVLCLAAALLALAYGVGRGGQPLGAAGLGVFAFLVVLYATLYARRALAYFRDWRGRDDDGR